jgi:uncharacterized protein (TIGR03066 family)
MRAILGCGLAAVLLFTAAVGAEDKKEEKIDAKKLLGKWQPSEAKKDADVVIEFLKDGKLSIIANAAGTEYKIDGTYKVNGTKLELAMSFMGKEKSDTATILKLTDDELTTEDGKGKKETLKRVKAK